MRAWWRGWSDGGERHRPHATDGPPPALPGTTDLCGLRLPGLVGCNVGGETVGGEIGLQQTDRPARLLQYRGIGGLVEDASHLPIAFRAPVIVVHAGTLLIARARAHPVRELFR